jgi:hypothetical protein
MNRWLKLIGCAVAFDIYWALVVMLRERGTVLWVVLAVIVWLTLPASLRYPALLLTVAGCALDALFALSGLIHFNSGWLLPVWMMALWLMFASVWIRLIRATQLPLVLLVLLAAVGGPVAYFLGERLGAIMFLHPAFTVLGWMAAGWLLLMAAFHYLMRKPL